MAAACGYLRGQQPQSFLGPAASEDAAKTDFTLRISPVTVELSPNRVISTVGYNGTSPGPAAGPQPGPAINGDGVERRLSPKTLEAYRRDVLQLLAFLTEHLGGAPSLKELAALTPADIRAFMAARRAQNIGGADLLAPTRELVTAARSANPA